MNCPILSKDKISSKDALESLHAQIVALATQKGYSAKEIKSALETCEIVVSERAIRDLLSASSGSKKKAVVGKNKKKRQSISKLAGWRIGCVMVQYHYAIAGQ